MHGKTHHFGLNGLLLTASLACLTPSCDQKNKDRTEPKKIPPSSVIHTDKQYGSAEKEWQAVDRELRQHYIQGGYFAPEIGATVAKDINQNCYSASVGFEVNDACPAPGLIGYIKAMEDSTFSNKDLHPNYKGLRGLTERLKLDSIFTHISASEERENYFPIIGFVNEINKFDFHFVRPFLPTEYQKNIFSFSEKNGCGAKKIRNFRNIADLRKTYQDNNPARSHPTVFYVPKKLSGTKITINWYKD